MYLAYTYLITNKITHQFYYGSRYQNIKLKRTPEQDLWIFYFTSSKEIKKLLKEYDRNFFEISIVFKSESYNECYWQEQDLIKISVINPLCLNKHYVDRLSGKNMFSMSGKTMSQKSRDKMSKSRTGVSRDPEIMKKVVETKRKKGNLGPTKESIEKQKITMKGRAPWNQGKIATEEAKNNQSISHRNKPWSQARRDAQNNKLK